MFHSPLTIDMLSLPVVSEMRGVDREIFDGAIAKHVLV